MNRTLCFRLSLLATLLAAAGCTQLLFAVRQGDCTEIRGRDGMQAVLLDSSRIGALRAASHHGGPLDTVPLIVGPELDAIGVKEMQLMAAAGDSVFSACAEQTQELRMCRLRNPQLLAADTELLFRVQTTAADWQLMRDVEAYWNSISGCDPNAGDQVM